MNLKRLWDTENKKMVWAIPTADPHKALQVWTNDDGSKLYVYSNSQYQEISSNESEPTRGGEKSKKGLEKSVSDDYTYSEYGPVWKQLEDETVGYYLTNEPTDLYNWDEGDKVSYRFMNGSSVLQDGTVEEGETPEYTGDTPTKAATAQYTYTFSGWEPEVGPISKKTDFKAQFTSTVNEYDITIGVNDANYGSVDVSSVDNVPYGTAISANENVLTIGTGASATVITATAEDGYAFSSWGELPATVTGNTSIQANFGFGPLQNYVLSNGENGLSIFGDRDANDYIEADVGENPETGDPAVLVDVGGLFSDEAFVGAYGDLNRNGWEYIFTTSLEAEDLAYLISEGADATAGEWKSGVWSALQTFYATPTEANADAAIAAIEATRDNVSGKLEPITWTIPEPEPTQGNGGR